MTEPVPDNTPKFLWSDVWLVLAIYLADPQGGIVPLESIIGAGDGINHAIFTPSELNGGLSRLHRTGLIVVHADGFALTREGMELATPSSKKAVSVSKHMEHIRRQLGAEDWKPGTNPNAADDPESEVKYVNDSMFGVAYRAYKNGRKERKRNK